MSRKNDLVNSMEKMDGWRGYYGEDVKSLRDNLDYSDTYKERRISELSTICIEKMTIYANAAKAYINSALHDLKEHNDTIVKRRGKEAYNLHLQNALKTLELTGSVLTQEQTSELVIPFLEDELAVMALKNAAVKGGMETIQALGYIAYQGNPWVKKLENLREFIDKYLQEGALSTDPTHHLNLAFMTDYIRENYPENLTGLPE